MQITPSKEERIARLIAFYLPQFHPIPENDEWWGEGFTEWTNVKKAQPLFRGHRQPRAPGELGYYDLRDPTIRAAQATMARDHGIEAFCYWHYWFGNGRRLLERPFAEVLATGEPDFPFCLCWANQTWTGIWHGASGRILMEQSYPGPEDDAAHFELLLPAFRDRRYVTVDGKPLFLVYNPFDLPDLKEFTGRWRTMAANAGLSGLYLIGMSNKKLELLSEHFDGTMAYGPGEYLEKQPTLSYPMRLIRRLSAGPVSDILSESFLKLVRAPARYEFSQIVEDAYTNLPSDVTTYPCVLTGWDNTPRAKRRGNVFENYTPDLLRKLLRKALKHVRSYPPQRQLVFLKAWNEWAEGNMLEPDAEMGLAFLEAVRQEVTTQPPGIE
jgi:lipopolysaccharide biosynthesis protein